MAAELLEKLAGESRSYSMDFSNLLGDDTISSVTSVVSNCSDLTIASITNDSTKVYCRISGGSCETCKVTFTIVTTDGNTLIDQGRLRVT